MTADNSQPRPLSRRSFLAGAGAGTGLAVLGPATWLSPAVQAAGRAGVVSRSGRTASGLVDATSTFFATTRMSNAAQIDTDSRADLWPTCWADDGNLYATAGDGRAFGQQAADIVASVIHGTPETRITGETLSFGDEIGTIWAKPAGSPHPPYESGTYSRKPTGMVAVDGNGDGNDEIYVAYQDLRRPPLRTTPTPNPNGTPNASISMSTDYGRTWQKTDAPMFTDYTFTTIMFLDYGQSNSHSDVLGPDGRDYVYAYGLDYNWRTFWTMGDAKADEEYFTGNPVDLYLARVPKNAILDRAQWEFFSGLRANGLPTWSSDIDQRQAVLHDERTVYPDMLERNWPRHVLHPENQTVLSQGSVVYNAPLKRYIYTSWTRYTFEFYEAPQPWGPWKLFLRKDFGASSWFGQPSRRQCSGLKEGGYAATIPSKFISADGKQMWVQSNSIRQRYHYDCGRANYNFSLRRLDVEPFEQSRPSNPTDPTGNLARSGAGVTPIEKCARHGFNDYYNDSDRRLEESSYDAEAKDVDFWGYTWTQAYWMDRVVYTTGDIFPDGGWFESLRVQVRQGFEWHDVRHLDISPAYPNGPTAGPRRTFELKFHDTWGDGVRIIGRPGGEAHFTTISELEVYFDERGHRPPPH